MPVFETSRGGRLDIGLPRTQWRELESAREAYEQLKRERNVTASRVLSLERKREKAIDADRRALAVWIKNGQKGAEPGPKEVEKIENEIRACNRRLEAIEDALDDAETDLIAVIDEHRDAWVEEVEDTHAQAREEYERAVEALSAARDVVSERFSLLYWLRWFPDEEKGAVSYRVRGSYVGKLIASWGDPYTFTQVIDALREDARARPDIEATHLRDLIGMATQQAHEERRANEEAGRGYFTDQELVRLQENEVTFHHGEGAVIRRRKAPAK